MTFKNLILAGIFSLTTCHTAALALNCDIAGDGDLPPTSTDVQALANVVLGNSSPSPCINLECDFDTSVNGNPNAGDVAALLKIVMGATTACQPANAAPVFTSATTANGTAGSAFTFTVTVTDTDTSQNGLTLSTTSKPAWMTLSGFTLSGTPTSAGTETVALSVTDGVNTVTQSISLTIAQATTLTVPQIFTRYGSQVTVTENGNFWKLTSTTMPEHKSPYFSPTTHAQYEAYNGSNTSYSRNPNNISSRSFEMNIPKSPASAASKTSTSLGPMGIALNGVPLFNQYAGPNQPLTNEINSFDQYNGHPQQQGMYHYHIEPLYITNAARQGEEGIVGFLLDGFPVYGPKENGAVATGLDTYHGHTHATDEFPNGIYHYHISTDAPYINGGQFYGTPGTTTN